MDLTSFPIPTVQVSVPVGNFMAAANQAAMKTAVGLGNADNTSDANKPVSTATAAALNSKLVSSVVTVSANRTVTAADAGALLNLGNGPFTISLGDIATYPATFAIQLFHTGNDIITVQAFGSQNIINDFLGAENTKTMQQGESGTLYRCGSVWGFSKTNRVTVGDGLSIDFSDTTERLSVAPASDSSIGGVIVGSGLAVDLDGVLSATGAAGPFLMASENGIAPGNSAAANTTALQALIDANTVAGASIYFTEPVPMNGGLVLKNNIKLMGNNWSAMKGSAPLGGGAPSLASLPSGAAFLITDETNVFLTLKSQTAIDGIIFDYPDQVYTATDAGDLITYPVTIQKMAGEPVSQISITRSTFVGNTTCIDFASTSDLTNFCADMTFDLLYGYPLGGGFINIAYCLDIPRTTRCHVNPSAGLYRCYATANDLPITNQIIDYVSSNGAAAFELYKTDEFMMSECFSFASKTAFYINDSYGALVNCEADATGVGCHVTITSDYKYVALISFNAINAAGTLSDRNAVLFDGTGGKLYCVGLNGITSTSGVVPASSTPGANSLLKVSGSGTQRVSLYGARTRSVNGAYAKFIDQTNGSAIVSYPDSDQQDVTTPQNAGQLPGLVLGTPLPQSSGGTGLTALPTYDFLSVLTSAEIAITNASTTLTLGRMHAIKATSADQTNALPTAVGNAGKFIAARITLDTTKFVTLDGNGSETLQGALTRIFWAGEVIWWMSDGANWIKQFYAFRPLVAKSYVSGTSQNVPSATITKILINTNDFVSVASMWDSGNNRIITPRPGNFISTAYLTWFALTGASNNTQAKLYVSGAEIGGDSREAASGGYPTPKITAAVTAVAGDYFELYSYQTSGSDQVLYLADPKLNYVQITETPSW